MSFETAMTSSLKRIFGIKKVTFDLPGETQEQECLFVQVTKAVPKIMDRLEHYRVEGAIRVFVNSDKMPYGFFSKAIDRAPKADKSQFYFFEQETNEGTYRNISERTISFVYFYDGQYNPEIGEMESIDLTTEVNE